MDKAETEALLERVRKTVADSQALIEKTNLRIAETDRMLASQGLTREQVAAFKFTPEQVALVNEELQRRGLGKLDEESVAGLTAAEQKVAMPDAGANENVAGRNQKFGVFMQQYRL